MMTPRVWADFNNFDEQGRVRLNTYGSLADLAQLSEVEVGMLIVAHNGEVEVDVVLQRGGSTWVGVLISDYWDMSRESDRQ